MYTSISIVSAGVAVFESSICLCCHFQLLARTLTPLAMKLFLFACAVVSASAVSADWNYMSQSTACIDTQFEGSTLTCALPTHTSYDKAYTMAASLPKCTANSYDCYNDKYCR